MEGGVKQWQLWNSGVCVWVVVCGCVCVGVCVSSTLG